MTREKREPASGSRCPSLAFKGVRIRMSIEWAERGKAVSATR